MSHKASPWHKPNTPERLTPTATTTRVSYTRTSPHRSRRWRPRSLRPSCVKLTPRRYHHSLPLVLLVHCTNFNCRRRGDDPQAQEPLRVRWPIIVFLSVDIFDAELGDIATDSVRSF